MSELPVLLQVRVRWAVAAVIGIGVGSAVSFALGIAAGVLAGWGTLTIISAGWVLRQVWSMSPQTTQDHATAEDPGRRTARLVAIIGSVISLGAVAVVIVQARHADGVVALVLAAIALVSIVASWALIQVDYMLRYARLYYEQNGAGEPKRGIDFNQREDPCYVDFAYFSVGLGMTYQVSDTNIGRTDIRRLVIAQTMLAYLFGAGILATVINLVAGLG